MQNYYDLFSDHRGTLRTDLGRFWNGKPKDEDDLHIGRVGIRLLAQCIKHSVLKRKGSVSQYAVGNNWINSTSRASRQGAVAPFSGDYLAALNRFPQHGRSIFDTYRC